MNTSSVRLSDEGEKSKLYFYIFDLRSHVIAKSGRSQEIAGR